MSASAEQWIASFAREVAGDPPDEHQVEQLLKLAAVAAHSSERIAAPITCWIAGRAGLDLDRAIEVAERIGSVDDANAD